MLIFDLVVETGSRLNLKAAAAETKKRAVDPIRIEELLLNFGIIIARSLYVIVQLEQRISELML